MVDELNRPAMIRVDNLPSLDEHAKDVRRIFATCGAAAVTVVGVAIASVFVALKYGVPLQTIALCVPIIMGIAIAAFAIGYGMPVGIVSLKRLELALRMSRAGLDRSSDAAEAIRKIADRVAVEPVKVVRRQPQESAP